MKFLEKLFGSKKRSVKSNETVTVYIYNPRQDSLADKIKHRKYISSIINGKYTQVNVSDAEIIRLIIEWIQNPNPVEVFSKLLSQIDVKFPITLKNLTYEHKYTFTCETSDGKTIDITLKFGDSWDRCDEMIVECNDTTSVYTYSPNSIKLKLESTTFIKDGIKLYNFYCKYFCHRLLTLPNDYEFKLEVSEPEHGDGNNILVLENAKEVENYLFSLASTEIPNFYEVYQKIKECYKFDNDTIKNMKYFKISLLQKSNDRTSKILGALNIEYGKLQEYIQTQDGVTILWSKKGDWSYIASDILVSFDKELKISTVSIVCQPEKTSNDVNISSIAKLADTYVTNALDNIIIP